MYGEERKKKMVEYIHNQQSVSVQELSSVFAVSESTVRRDLKELEEEQLISRAHGGALAVDHVNFEPIFSEKADKYMREKQLIASYAVQFIAEGDTVLLDAGTTTLALGQQLKAFTHLTVVTNSVAITDLLQKHDSIEVHLLGGMLRKETLALVGPFAENTLSSLHVDKAFIATNGLDVDHGLTTPNLIEAATKKQMVQSAQEVFVVADHSKAGKVSFAKFADVKDVDNYIIDSELDERFADQLREEGVTVHLVS
jgi:DeoR family transcriptional regulator, fructose operon transcriptional repressor